jgi:hypothetical protein
VLDGFGDDTGEVAAAGEDEGVPGWLKVVGLTFLLAGLALGAYALLVVGLKRHRVRRRFAAARNNRERVNAVWDETVEHLRPLGVARAPHETMPEFAHRVGVDAAPARTDLEGLGGLAVEANYGPDDPVDEVVAAAEAHRDGVVRAIEDLTTTTDRLKDQLDPRPLVRR